MWTASALRSRPSLKGGLCQEHQGDGQCRNQESNPDSLAYKRKLEELVDEDALLLEDHTPSNQQDRMDR